MGNLTIIAAVIIFLLLIGAGIYAARAMRGKEIRQSEERRPVDKGKHVEL